MDEESFDKPWARATWRHASFEERGRRATCRRITARCVSDAGWDEVPYRRLVPWSRLLWGEEELDADAGRRAKEACKKFVLAVDGFSFALLPHVLGYL